MVLRLRHPPSLLALRQFPDDFVSSVESVSILYSILMKISRLQWVESTWSFPGVKKLDRTSDRPCGSSVTKPGGWQVSTVEQHVAELYSSDLGASPHNSDDESWTIVKAKKKQTKNKSVKVKSKWKVSMDNSSGCDHDHDWKIYCLIVRDTSQDRRCMSSKGC